MTFRDCNTYLEGYKERKRIEFANQALLNDGLAKQIASFVAPKNPKNIKIITPQELFPHIFNEKKEKPKKSKEEIEKASTIAWRSWLGI